VPITHRSPDDIADLITILGDAMKLLGPELNALNRTAADGSDLLNASSRFIASVAGRDHTTSKGPDVKSRQLFVEAANDMAESLRKTIGALAHMRHHAQIVLGHERDAAERMFIKKQASARAVRHSALS
jgi:hypothetical protein